MTPEKILQLDDIAFNGKKGLFTGKAKRKANIAVMELDGKTFFANSQATNDTDPAYYNFKGDKSSLVLMKPDGERRFNTLEIGHDRKVDSEAKLFEYLADIAEDGKPYSVNMLSERCMCDSCRGVMNQFQEKYPNVTINVVSGRKDRSERNNNNPWKYRK
ncbi:MAG: deaminase domain-containing protein [Eubacteriales bacterium]|nr:deaminase domain-containing protein [Eubacteriales bacterium]